MICANALFLIPACLDRYLAPRFLFLSVSLLVGLWGLRRDLRTHADWRLNGMDYLILGWYGLNLASVAWAFSWTEGVFYAQKAFLFVLVYWFFRQAMYRNADMVRTIFKQAVTVLTYATIAILFAQIFIAFSAHGLDNEKLYEYATGVSGNKSLVSDFLFFLLIFNGLFYKSFEKKLPFWILTGLLLALIVLLQTRTVYVAVVGSALLFFPARAILQPAFAPVFLKRILPAGILVIGLLAVLISLKGHGNSLAERLNPATYAESISANERRFVWYKTDELNKDHFWLGVGDGSWKLWFPSKNIQGGYRLQEQNVVFTRVHNDYLEVRAEMGMIGVVLFCAIFGAAFLAGLYTLRQNKNETERYEILVVSVGLFGYCVIQYFDFPRERIEMQVILAVLFAWLAYSSRDLWARLPGFSVQKIAPLLGWIVVIGLLFNILIAWKRIAGEIHNVKMMQAQAQKNYRSAAQEARAAQNTFYVYDDVVLPLQYHEGTALYQINEIGAAVQAFEQAYRLNPWSFPVLNNYASALIQNGNYREAIPLLEKTVDINPRFNEGKLNLTYSWYQLGDYPKALDWLQRVDTIPNPQNELDRQKNQLAKTRKAEFLKLLETKMK